MAVLDQAPIKALRHPTSCSGTVVAKPQAAVPHVAVGPAMPLSQAPAELADTSAAPSAKLPSSDRPSVAAQRKARGEGRLQPATAEPNTTSVGPSVAFLLQEAFQAATPVGPSVKALLDEVYQTPTAAEPPTASVGPSVAALLDEAFQAKMVAVETPSPAKISETATLPTEAVAASGAPLTTPPADTGAISLQPNESPWRVLCQVDHVVWPSVQRRLLATAPAAIEQMTDGLLSICAAGSKVLGLASCARGEGVTTLLLAVAPKLVSQGRKVVLVDANWGNPQLGKSLGLLPQIGWEETLCGGLPLEKVVIESLADGLAVLPVRTPPAGAIAPAQIATSLDILAREFDVVLVDLGPLARVEEEHSFVHGAAARMDAVILVQNVRITTPERLAEVRRRLAASNFRLSGTIQNFVAGFHDRNYCQHPSRSRFQSACDLVWHAGLFANPLRIGGMKRKLRQVNPRNPLSRCD